MEKSNKYKMNEDYDESNIEDLSERKGLVLSPPSLRMKRNRLMRPSMNVSEYKKT